MTKKEFLQELQRNLAGRLDSGQAAEHVEYYSEYIEIAVRKGETEETVLQRLGNPRLIAKSLTDAAGHPSKSPGGFSFAGRCMRAWDWVKAWFASL